MGVAVATILRPLRSGGGLSAFSRGSNLPWRAVQEPDENYVYAIAL